MIISQRSAAETTVLPSAGIRPRPQPANYGLPYSFILLASDVCVVILAGLAAQSLAHVPLATLLGMPEAAESVTFSVLVSLFIYERIGSYRRSFSTNALDEVYSSLAASVLALAPAFLIFIMLPALHGFRSELVIALGLTGLGVGFARYVEHTIRQNAFPPPPRRIAVVGLADRVAAVPRDLSLSAGDEVVRLPVEDFDESVAEARGDVAQLPWLRDAIQRRCHELIITEALPAELMPSLLRLTEARGIKLAFAPLRIRPHACDFTVRRDGGLALLYPRSLAVCTSGALKVRRVFDLAVALPALVLLAPVLFAIGLAVYLDSGPPIFYRQVRVGKDGREFKIIKFRTMRADAETQSGPVWARSGEDRTTRIGRFLRRTSLDELPQLFNVAHGEMSIVGPRPERPFYVEQFRKMLPRYDERHLAKPGITGWSHIYMRRNVDTSAIGERLSYDLFYLENWSVFMDLLIICKTGAEFLFHSAA